MSTEFRAMFLELCDLSAKEGYDSPRAKELLDKMVTPVIQKALMDTTVKFYSEGRESEVPPGLRNDELLRLNEKGASIGFTAKIEGS